MQANQIHGTTDTVWHAPVKLKVAVCIFPESGSPGHVAYVPSCHVPLYVRDATGLAQHEQEVPWTHELLYAICSPVSGSPHSSSTVTFTNRANTRGENIAIGSGERSIQRAKKVIPRKNINNMTRGRSIACDVRSGSKEVDKTSRRALVRQVRGEKTSQG